MFSLETMIPTGFWLLFCLIGKFRQQREEILAGRKRRTEQLEVMLEESKARLAEHNNGKKILMEAEKLSLEKKISIYNLKLDTLRVDLNEHEVQRIIKKERLRDDHIKARRAREEL